MSTQSQMHKMTTYIPISETDKNNDNEEINDVENHTHHYHYYHRHHHHFGPQHHHHYFHNHSHREGPHLGSDRDHARPRTYAVHCKAGPGYALSIRGGTAILAPLDRSDEHQHWFREDKLGARVKDEHGFPSFALVNKATGKALGHPAVAGRPVELVQFDGDGHGLDGAVLWTAAGEDGDEFKAVRMQNNVRLNMDALGGVKESGGVRDGTVVGVWEWNGGDNQRWRIVPYD